MARKQEVRQRTEPMVEEPTAEDSAPKPDPIDTAPTPEPDMPTVAGPEESTEPETTSEPSLMKRVFGGGDAD